MRPVPNLANFKTPATFHNVIRQEQGKTRQDKITGKGQRKIRQAKRKTRRGTQDKTSLDKTKQGKT